MILRTTEDGPINNFSVVIALSPSKVLLYNLHFCIQGAYKIRVSPWDRLGKNVGLTINGDCCFAIFSNPVGCPVSTSFMVCVVVVQEKTPNVINSNAALGLPENLKIIFFSLSLAPRCPSADNGEVRISSTVAFPPS